MFTNYLHIYIHTHMQIHIEMAHIRLVICPFRMCICIEIHTRNHAHTHLHLQANNVGEQKQRNPLHNAAQSTQLAHDDHEDANIQGNHSNVGIVRPAKQAHRQETPSHTNITGPAKQYSDMQQSAPRNKSQKDHVTKNMNLSAIDEDDPVSPTYPTHLRLKDSMNIHDHDTSFEGLSSNIGQSGVGRKPRKPHMVVRVSDAAVPLEVAMARPQSASSNEGLDTSRGRDADITKAPSIKATARKEKTSRIDSAPETQGSRSDSDSDSQNTQKGAAGARQAPRTQASKSSAAHKRNTTTSVEISSTSDSDQDADAARCLPKHDEDVEISEAEIKGAWLEREREANAMARRQMMNSNTHRADGYDVVKSFGAVLTDHLSFLGPVPGAAPSASGNRVPITQEALADSGADSYNSDTSMSQSDRGSRSVRTGASNRRKGKVKKHTSGAARRRNMAGGSSVSASDTSGDDGGYPERRYSESESAHSSSSDYDDRGKCNVRNTNGSKRFVSAEEGGVFADMQEDWQGGGTSKGRKSVEVKDAGTTHTFADVQDDWQFGHGNKGRKGMEVKGTKTTRGVGGRDKPSLDHNNDISGVFKQASNRDEFARSGDMKLGVKGSSEKRSIVSPVLERLLPDGTTAVRPAEAKPVEIVRSAAPAAKGIRADDLAVSVICRHANMPCMHMYANSKRVPAEAKPAEIVQKGCTCSERHRAR
jgi:hypothetical protein